MYACAYIFICMYVCLYVATHKFCSITEIVRDFVRKYLCSFNTELHYATNCTSSDTYCSSCSVPTCYSNVN